MANISNEELKSCLTSPKDSKKEARITVDSRSSTCYTLGLETVEEENPVAYAKRVSVEDTVSHYIKQDKYGNLFNPQGLYSERNESKNTRYNSTWSFKLVTPKSFDLYLKFLETKNEAWLSNAERELA